MSRGKLIAIEGIDGAGKSTLVHSVISELHNENCYQISGVGNMFFMKECRRIRKKNIDFTNKFLNIAWLMDFYETGKKIEKKLYEGKNVITDRYILSAKVYAEATTDVDMSSFFEIYSLLPKPDFTFLLDIEPSIAVERIKKRNKKIAFYENEHSLNLIRKKYKEKIKRESIDVFILNGNLETQLNSIMEKIKQ